MYRLLFKNQLVIHQTNVGIIEHSPLRNIY